VFESDKNQSNSLKKFLVDVLLWLLLILCCLYVFGFFYNQYKIPDRILLGHQVVTYSVADNCELLVESPQSVPIESPDIPGRPVNVWFYLGTKDISSATTPTNRYCSHVITVTAPITYSIMFGPIGEGIEFTDQNGELVPAVLSFVPAHNGSIADPQTLYIRRTSNAELPVYIELQVQVFYTDLQGRFIPLSTEPFSSPPRVYPELPRDSRFRHLREVVFQVGGPIQWLVTVVVGLLGLPKIYYDWQEKQHLRIAKEEEIQQQRIDRHKAELESIKRQITEASVPESGFHRYINLHDKYQNPEIVENSGKTRQIWHRLLRQDVRIDIVRCEQNADAMQVLRECFDTGWLVYLRKDLIRQLSISEATGTKATKRLVMFAWEWKRCIGEEGYKQLLVYCELMASPPSLSEQNWDTILEGFQILGLDATDCTANWIDGLPIVVEAPTLKKAKPTGAEALDFKPKDIIKDSFETQFRAIARYLIGHSKLAAQYSSVLSVSIKPRLWPEERKAREHTEVALLGAERAEYDNHFLLDAFHVTSAWHELKTTHPTLFIAPPGSGRTALIWKAREELLNRSFPVYAQSTEWKSETDLTQSIQHAFALAWCEMVAQDPYALVGLEEGERHGITTLLLQDFGGQESLFEHLEYLGLKRDNPDRNLLEEVLNSIVFKQSGIPFWSFPHLHPNERDYTLLLVDVSVDDIELSNQIVACLLHRWLPALGPRAIVPKVFVYQKPQYCPVSPVNLTWSQHDLCVILEKRDKNLFDSLEKCLGDQGQPVEALLLAAQGSPKRLIALSNALLQEKEHFPLDREAFNEIMRRCI